MSRPLVPRPLVDNANIPPPQTTQRPKKISTACGACKARKTRCSGGTPCDACATRSSPCLYDAASDQRRKVANQRNIHELENALRDLEHHRELLGGVIATIRAGDPQANEELIHLIRTGIDLSQLAAHVRNECRSNLAIKTAFDAITFVINGPDELPSPAQILGNLGTLRERLPIMAGVDTTHDSPEYESPSAHSASDGNIYGVDPTL